mgnify:CR=1 FL=1
MKMIGIIFSNIYDAALGDLTKHRTLASLPFGGRYRLIDFVLSNMANSNIENVGIITKTNYQSLMDHLGSCAEWDMNRKNGKVAILPPFGIGQSNVYQGKLEALEGALPFIRRSKGNYVLLSDSNNLCNIDYENALESHIKSGKKITVIANRQEPAYDYEIQDVVLCEKDGCLTDIALNHTYSKENLLGMGMYIVNKQYLVEIVEECVSHGLFRFEQDFLQRYFINEKIEVNVYEFKRTVLRNRDILSYFQNHCRLLEDDVARNDIFDPQNPIYTKVRDEVPTYYSQQAHVDTCLIADGCRIRGEVDNSIIFRDVTIEEGAIVKHCIIMQGTVVEKNANLAYAIIDKDATITANRTLIGAPVNPIIVQKGEKV